MEFRNKSGEPVDVVLDSGRVLSVGKSEKFEATGADAQSLLDHPLFERTDEPASRSTTKGDGSDA